MQWIRVKEKLPEEGEEVLRYGGDFPEFKVDYIVKFENAEQPYIWARAREEDFPKINHWMPLPEPPES